MCGLAFTSFPVGSALGAVMRHRGPDGYGFHRTPIGELHHSRLAVCGEQIQPVARTGTLTIYNGEVYTPCVPGADAQLVANTLALGARALSALNGTWAILQVHAQERRVLAVRDRFGLRPLFRYFDGEHLVYASNVRTIAAALEAVGVELVERADYPAKGRVPLPCFYEHVEPLPAGCAEIAHRTAEGWTFDRTHWYLPRPFDHGDLAELIRDAVRIRCHPQGALCVSGGVDSYLLYAAMPTQAPLPRYHLDVTGEADAARRCHATVLNPPTLTREEIDDVLEQPYYATPPNLYLAAALRAHDPELRVVLTGLGADELFGGYRHHDRPCTPAAVEEVYELRGVRSSSWRDVELGYVIPHHYGYRTDQAFLRYGLEARHPFMDHRIVETALTQPTDGKARLRALAARLGWQAQDKRGFTMLV